MQNSKEYIAARGMGCVLCESTGEYVLPDYNGDIKKILFTDARVMPSSSFPGGDSIEYSGVVAYNVIYLDSEDNVTHAEFTSEYEGEVRLVGDSLADYDIESLLQSYTARPVGPRKLSVRATLASTVYVCENKELNSGSIPEGYEPEARMGRIKVRSLYVDKSGEREYAEELGRIDGAMEDEVEVLYTSSSVRGNAAICNSGIEYKGEIDVLALIKNGKAVPFTMEKKIPFCEMFFEGSEAYLALTDTEVFPSLVISSLKCNINKDDDGVAIVVSVITEGKMRALGNCELDLMLDGYLTECESENSFSSIDYVEQMPTAKVNLRVSDSLTRSSLGLENTRNILLPSAELKIGEIKLGNNTEITGEVRFSGIACEINELGDPVYTQLKLAVPFKENVNNSSQYADNTRLEYTAAVVNVHIELDNESVKPTAEVLINIIPLIDKHECYVSEINVTGDEIERDESIVTVYYPEQNETLFDISKKYRVPTLRVASVNALSESVFARSDAPVTSLGIEKIIIR